MFVCAGADPVSAALVASEAKRLGSRAFGMLDSVGDLESPFLTQIYGVWQIDNRLAKWTE